MTLYLQLTAGLSLLGILLFFISRRNEKHRWLSYQDLRKLSRVSLGFLLLLALLPLQRNEFHPTPSAQIWAGKSMRNFELSQKTETPVTIFNTSHEKAFSLEKTSLVLGLLVGIGLLLALFRILTSMSALLKLKSTSLSLHTFRNSSVLVSESIGSPVSFVLGRHGYVVIPTFLLKDQKAYRLALEHEFEHLRKRDPQWTYASVFFKSLFFWNPFAQLFFSTQETIQEFACDEALFGQKGFSVQAYGRCLLEVAKSGGAHYGISCGVMRSPSQLKRRILFMMDSATKKRKSSIWPVAGLMFLSLAATTWAFEGTIQDRRISLERAKELASRAQTSSGFPITVNERVLKELNRYIGTPDGREYMRASLERMENYKGMITLKLSDYRLPEEFLAVPIIESGYQNLPPKANPVRAAGLWQFMAETARNYGLVVNAKKDERMNVELETDAGCRYLGSLFLRFRDWELAMLSYYVGEHKLEQGIRKTGSRNAWELIEAGFGGDSNYLARVVTAMIILKNPDVLN